jgi:hypothetical protein
MKTSSILIGTLAAVTALAPAARAQQASSGRPTLHVDDAYDNCFFDLHPELTEAQFKEFAGELGSILRSRQLGDARTLGKGRFELSAQYTDARIDDAKGAWNNTMSHPHADHYLGEAIAFPRLSARLGVSDRVDVGAWGTVSQHSNYWIVGADTRIAILRQDRGRPVSVSLRPSLSGLFGPDELTAGSASLDITASRAIGPVSPYLGVTTTASTAHAHAPDVALHDVTATGGAVYGGLSYQWRKLALSAEVEHGTLFSYGLQLGTRF